MLPFAPPNLQTNMMLGRGACMKRRDLGRCASSDPAALLASASGYLRQFDLVGVTEQMAAFLVLLCDAAAIHHCPKYESLNVNSQSPSEGQRTKHLSTLFPSQLSAEATVHVHTRLAQVDTELFSNVRTKFEARVKLVAERVQAYDARPATQRAAAWNVCDHSSDAFQMGLRVGFNVGQLVRRGNRTDHGQLARHRQLGNRTEHTVTAAWEEANLVLVPHGSRPTRCLPCKTTVVDSERCVNAKSLARKLAPPSKARHGST